MKSLLLSRKQADFLVINHPFFMANEWPKLSRTWFIGGVQVIGTEQEIEEIESRLAAK